MFGYSRRFSIDGQTDEDLEAIEVSSRIVTKRANKLNACRVKTTQSEIDTAQDKTINY